MDVIARIKLQAQALGVGRIARGCIEVDDPVEPATRSYPRIHFLPDGLAFGREEGQAFGRKDRPARHLEAVKVRSVDQLTETIDQRLSAHALAIWHAWHDRHVNVVYALQDQHPFRPWPREDIFRKASYRRITDSCSEHAVARNADVDHSPAL